MKDACLCRADVLCSCSMTDKHHTALLLSPQRCCCLALRSGMPLLRRLTIAATKRCLCWRWCPGTGLSASPSPCPPSAAPPAGMTCVTEGCTFAHCDRGHRTAVLNTSATSVHPPHGVLPLRVQLRDLAKQIAKSRAQPLIHSLRKCAACKMAALCKPFRCPRCKRRHE